MTDYHAKINAKGCDKTGLTEDLAAQLYNGGRSHLIAIVELHPTREHNDRDTGTRTIDLTIQSIEPVVDGDLNGTLEDHVRDIVRALYRNRKLAEGSQELPFEDDGPEPKVQDILQQGSALLETGEDGEPALWNGDTSDEAEQPTDDEPLADDVADEDEQADAGTVLAFSGKGTDQ